LPEWPKGAVCKTVGFAYPGSNPGPATTSENSPSPAGTPGGAAAFLSGCVRPGPAVYGWPGRIRGEVSPAPLVLVLAAEGVFDELPVDPVPAVDALGVHPQEHLHAVPGPFGDLGRVNARVQPGG
jgi:hypothetical protein